MKREWKRIWVAAVLMTLFLVVTGCGFSNIETIYGPGTAEKNGEVYILYTSDVHCGIDQGFGYTGLQQIRDNLEAQGYETILVDNGDAIQGEAIGLLSAGESIIDLMNAAHYDVAIPGNHEFDFGMNRFLELTKKAEFPYVCCNLTREGEPVLAPYVIKEAAGMKIAFVGVTTPESLTKSDPDSFQNEQGEFIYSFQQDETGEGVWNAVQKSVDEARAEGADLVYVLGHMGMSASSTPWTYADVISHTNGIDVFLDGHSHDMEQVVMKNKDGENVVRSACGTKFQGIGYSHITADRHVAETNVWTWTNKDSVTNLFGIQNVMSEEVAAAKAEVAEQLEEVVGKSDVELTVYDPVEKQDNGDPIPVIRLTETNLGDLVADAYRAAGETDIGVSGGGGIRGRYPKGEITNGNIIDILPFDNDLAVVEMTGQQILDMLEWGSHRLPAEFGGFLQVSGLTYEIDVSVPSGCKKNEDGKLIKIEGPRRVKNVKVGDEPIDPDKKYTLAGSNFILLKYGDGFTCFKDAKVLQESNGTIEQALLEYIRDSLGGTIGSEYADPYGQGRIVIKE